MHTTSRATLAALALAASTVTARAQQAGLLLPRSARLSPLTAGDTVRSHRLLMRRPGDAAGREYGVQQDGEYRAAAQGLVTTQSVAAVGWFDTLETAPGLSPRWEHLHLADRTIRLAYHGDRVERWEQRRDSAAHSGSARFDEPVFAFNEVPLLVRSLPLEPGFSTIVPLYSEVDARVEHDTLTVIGRSAPRSRDWTIRFADSVVVITWTLAGDTRTVVDRHVLNKLNHLRLWWSEGAGDTACAPEAASLPAASWLARAGRAVGLAQARGRIVHYHSIETSEQNYQSDRTYPPYFSAFVARDVAFDPLTGLERLSSHTTFIGQTFQSPVLLSAARATWVARDTGAPSPSPAQHPGAQVARALDPWAVLHDWAEDTSVSVEARCEYRDYTRIVLRRTGAFGPERLFLDPRTAVPVKLDRVEPHYLWGQQLVEYIYSTWVLDGGVAHPGSSFRVADGDVEISRTVADFSVTSKDSAPSIVDPPAGPAMAVALPVFLQALPPDTARVGATAFVLRNAGYGETVVLARDTVFVLDATQSEARARQDSVWIGRLFPGAHPIVVVVTDLAWPHVGGVRFWVASGATIVSHRGARAFLEQVVARRWTLTPDKLEGTQPRPALRFRAVSDSLSLAGGEIGLYAIDGAGSEGALMAWLRADRFLWASDYIQDLSQPTLYAAEVLRAAARAGIEPATVAAEHLRTQPWDAVRRANAGVDVEGP